MKWHGIMKIDSIQHMRNGVVLWQQNNIYNILHTMGEQFMLSCCFANDGSLVPTNYYFGLDARPEISVDDEIADLLDEPAANGYSRQSVNSSTGFTIELVNGFYRASSPVNVFSSSGIGYGPVQNIFMVTTSDNTGILISSATLSSPITLSGGDNINLKMSLQLQSS
jgi:hypothetical protein